MRGKQQLKEHLINFTVTAIKPVVIAFVLSFLVIVVFSYWLPLQSYGIQLITPDISFLLSLIFAVLTALVAFLMLLSKKLRKNSLKYLIFCTAYIIFLIPSMMVGELVRKNEFINLATRSENLISAINKFQETEGKLPNNLTDLVPKYLSAYPTTKMAAYPKYYYKNDKDNNRWSIYIPCGNGVLNWDEFFYYSDQDYSKISSITKIGDWVYYNE